MRFEYGDVDCTMGQSHHVVMGEIKVGGQEHFYMETQVALAVPLDNGEYEFLFQHSSHFKSR